MKKNKIIIFGVGTYAEIINQYLTDDSEYEVVAFTLDDEYIKEDTYLGLPMVPFSKVENIYSPKDYFMHVGLSYTNLNHLRKDRYYEAKNKGYMLPTYISSKATVLTKYPIGDNCFIFEDNTIQPFVKIGSNIILWSGNHIGHHGEIESHNFISSHVVISGQCLIKSNCFIGVNSTVANGVTIETENLIGAGSYISKNTKPKSVYVPPRSVKLDKTSDQFKL
jgi:sugar O-acyltransferase (sialic acid O-acetyltransferase NeuD family)|tara:strand:+ start:1356 stop:2021 length:666 start_codon:yes stop_codon:yes gene_type:complete